MTKGFYNLTSAMLTQGRYMDVISNNMANNATAGFKTDRFTYTTFEEVMWKRVGNTDKDTYTELGKQSWITAPSRLYTDYSQGPFDETGQNLDFAINGDGFFKIQTESGNVLTRSGNFSLDEEGYLCLPGQGRVLSVNNTPIQLVTDKIRCDNFGGLFTEGGDLIGRVGVFTVDNPEDTLEKNDQGLFTGSEGTQANVQILHQMLERPNTDMAEQMVAMITAQRAYQSAAEVIKIYDQEINRAATEVGRLS